MKSMQRKFGGLMKRSEDQADVGTVLAEFKAADDMLDRLIQDIKSWRNGWEDVLKLQYDCSEAFASLYKPIEPTSSPDMHHQPAVTPSNYMQKCLGLQKLYSELKTDLQQEITMIDNKLLRPAEQAKQSTKQLHKTLKHRENTKLDYERYLSRTEHARRKETRTVKEEAALAAHEQNLAQAQIDYETADEQVKEAFPPITAAILSLVPYLLTNQLMLQTTLSGQVYTVLDKYTRAHHMPNPAPSDAEIVRVWQQEFDGFRQELEQGISIIASGKAVQMGMALPPEKSTVTGLGLRGKVGGLAAMGRKGSAPAVPTTKPTIGARTPSGMSGKSLTFNAPYDQNPTALTPSWPNNPPPPPAYDQSPGNISPPSRYATPVNGNSPTTTTTTTSPAPDYFAATSSRPEQNRSFSQSSLASAAAAVGAGKKKPAPPIPIKRIQSSQATYVTAVYDFEGQNEGDLAFREGDRIKVVKKTDSVDDWWEGELRGRVGSFPANYVEV
ncbi:hypothetical protein BAUCODRAFT_65537 [Baudoinia panamericana UAMH 10762]|uniref:SH3 domain-containing protein n=1 Tax=Baudoinia panamericana (strain UAMH 10762) TaxID=717646 RepID=M2N531_BAUPA|nr:uncharacterized protein BAUCODRAFT_65537 [Baudoinia panamericana UAMH 10762]EMC99108.1 hypothetical protein BAUCODRAFT_65537 [Baudoinia panamericana UAMH 10762]